MSQVNLTLASGGGYPTDERFHNGIYLRQRHWRDLHQREWRYRRYRGRRRPTVHIYVVPTDPTAGSSTVYHKRCNSNATRGDHLYDFVEVAPSDLAEVEHFPSAFCSNCVRWLDLDDLGETDS